MAIRGRNLSASVDLKSKGVLGAASAADNGSVALTANIMGVAARSSIQIQEIGVTIFKGSGGSPTNAAINADAKIAFWYQKPLTAAVKFATVNLVALTAAVGDEYTSRDGTITFVAAYDHPAKRVFPKGTVFGAEWDTGDAGAGNTGSNGDMVLCWAQAPDFGAEPA